MVEKRSKKYRLMGFNDLSRLCSNAKCHPFVDPYDGRMLGFVLLGVREFIGDDLCMPMDCCVSGTALASSRI